jgi:hypothetical protein
MSKDVWRDNPLLEFSLPVAMLSAIEEVGRLTPDQRQRLGTEWAQTVAEHGDDLMYGGKSCVAAYAALARGLAALAHNAGGVTFGGYHWCTGSRHFGTREDAPCAAEIAREAAGAVNG